MLLVGISKQEWLGRSCCLVFVKHGKDPLGSRGASAQVPGWRKLLPRTDAGKPKTPSRSLASLQTLPRPKHLPTAILFHLQVFARNARGWRGCTSNPPWQMKHQRSQQLWVVGIFSEREMFPSLESPTFNSSTWRGVLPPYTLIQQWVKLRDALLVGTTALLVLLGQRMCCIPSLHPSLHASIIPPSIHPPILVLST